MQIFGTINFLFQNNRPAPQPQPPVQQQLSPPSPRRERDLRLPIYDEHHPLFYRQIPNGPLTTIAT